MYLSIMLRVSLLFISALISSEAYKLSFPRYSFRNHPMYTLKQFKDQSFRPGPVVMRRYVRVSGLGINVTEDMMFTTGKAEYFNFHDGTPLGDPLDALYISPVYVKPSGLYLEVNLNLNARVFLAMVKTKMSDRDLAEPKNITGLGENWHNLRSIKTKDGEPIRIGSLSRGTSYELPGRAYVVESYFGRAQAIHLPAPKHLRVNGKETIQYFLFFAKPRRAHRPATAFKYPDTPSVVTDLSNGKKLSVREPVIPNEQCPQWLHDLYRTRSRDLVVAKMQREPFAWRTWHPLVDPIYWCYFDHEHGSYPGKYRPLFDYTAWKTPDNTTSHGRQNESDEGFKVYSFPLHDQKKYVIMTIHMQCSKARRFYARHHTMTFAVLDEKWRLLMEFHMKVDFGVAVLAMSNLALAPINKEQEMLRKEQGRRMKRFRRFNILNLDNYPKNVDTRYRLHLNAKPTMKNKNRIANGIYERWVAPLNSCQACEKGSFDSFVFDVRNAATAKKRPTDPDNAPMAKLKGNSISRIFAVSPSDVFVGPQYCHLQGMKTPKNMFYTDPYFETAFSSSGKNRVGQFIRPGAQRVVFKRGFYSAVDPWAGYYEMAPRHDKISRRGHRNIENAAKAEIN